MSLAQVPSSRVVSDHFYDLIHQLLELCAEWPEKICLSGSFSLNAFGVINRPVSDIDLCVLTDVFDEVVEKLRERVGTWFEKEINRLGDNLAPAYVRFRLAGGTDAKLCIFRHRTFPDNLGTINLHGRRVQLFPAADIIRYKMVSLNATFIDSSKTPMALEQAQKHLTDILSWANRCHNAPPTIASSVLTLAAHFNLFCSTHGHTTRCEASKEFLTFRFFEVASDHVQHPRGNTLQQGAV